MRVQQDLFFTALMALCVFTSLGFAGTYGGGTGEVGDPYQIWDADDLLDMSATPGDWDKHFNLMDDIILDPNNNPAHVFTTAVIAPDTSSNSGFQGIPFTGFFDGNNHSIRNLEIATTQNIIVGLFGQIEGDNPLEGIKIKNLSLMNCTISCINSDKVGSIAGCISKIRMDNCHAEGVSIEGNQYVGGLVGDNLQGIITQCHSAGTIQGANYVGGLLGRTHSGSLDSDNIGHMGDWHFPGSVFACYANCDVSSNGYVGGLIGKNYYANISSCYTKGIIQGDYPCGLIGQNSYKSDYYGSIAYCFSACQLEAQVTAVGISSGDRLVYLSYWDESISGPTEGGVGLPKTTGKMMSMDTFSGWGYNGVWILNEGSDYPHLIWENTPGELIDEMPLFYGGGIGDPNDPFQIWSPEHLNEIDRLTGHFDKHFVLMADIDMTGIEFNQIALKRSYPTWELEGPAFTGEFNGSGHSIIGLKGCLIGLLGAGGEIKHLTLENAITKAIPYHDSYDGAFAMWIEDGARITSCHAYDISLGVPSFSGGIAGYNNGEISGCTVTGNIASAGSYLGGIAGVNEGLIASCFSNCQLGERFGTITDSIIVGGIAGQNKGDIQYCGSDGSLTGQQIIGGIAGENEGLIFSSFSNAQVTHTSKYGFNTMVGILGGCVAVNKGEIICCYSTGGVSGIAAGGLVSKNTSSSKILFSYSRGSVSGTFGIYESDEYAGFVYEDEESCIFQSFWDVDVSGVSTSDGGWGKSSVEMMSLDTFKNWGFHGQWSLDDTNDYPRLVWENAVGDQIVDPVRMYAGGAGTSETPFQINSCEQLQMLGNYMDDWDKHYVLTEDIIFDPNIQNNFDPIGVTGLPFSGCFDGNDFTISNLRYSKGKWDIGLFGFISNKSNGAPPPIIERLTIQNSAIASSYDRIGSLIGSVATWGTVEDAIVHNCSVSNAEVTGHNFVGGLVGSFDGSFQQCNLSHCSFNGIVNGDISTGGLAGKLNSGAEYCRASGVVMGNENIGGLVGEAHDPIRACFFNGTVSGSKNIGGLIGKNNVSNSPWSCYSAGQVNGTTNVGGLVGYTYRASICSYTNAKVQGDTSVGALIGYQSQLGSDSGESYWDGEICGATDAVGNSPGGFVSSQKTTEEMKRLDTYYKWVGKCSWVIDEDVDYPHLIWENTSGVLLCIETFLTQGDGTADNPYIIDEARDIYLLCYLDEYWACHYKMIRDIDMSDYSGQAGNPAFEMIRPDVSTSYFDYASFSGCFDGNGHIISSLVINADNLDGVGFFGGLASNGVIQNLGLGDITIHGDEKLGLLVGINYGTIENCFIRDGSIAGYSVNGGLVGENNGLITNSSYVGTVTGYYNNGGLCGINEGTISGCCSTGEINGNYYSGGLIGRNRDAVSNSFSTASVDGTSDLGGLIGNNGYNTYVNNCYATGAVAGQNNIGGFVGNNFYDAVVDHCYATGLVIGTQSTGGFVGASSGDITNSFWDVDTSKIGSSDDDNFGATGKITDDMQVLSTFTNAYWDFVEEDVNGSEDVWRMPYEPGYPILSWEKDIAGDMTGAYGVDFADFAVFAESWQVRVHSDNWSLVCDFNGDKRLTLSDYAWLSGAWGLTMADAGWEAAFDLAENGVIDIHDLAVFADGWLATYDVTANAACDLDGSGLIDADDLAILLGHWLAGFE